MKFDDPKVWNLFKEGKTKGIFQLESNLGKAWSKKLEPNNIEELAALISLLRPGCLNAIIDGKSMTQHYVDRKHGRDEVIYIHDSLKEFLDVTYGVIVYQEQVMRISQKLAGFSLEEADDLRKAIGKKKADLMNKVKIKFLDGCGKVGIVPGEIASQIFSWIEKSARYLFNKSHAVAYAIDAYWSAYKKLYDTTRFFASYLTFSSEKPDPHQEVGEIVSEAKLFDINFQLPKISFFTPDFSVIGDKKEGNIMFGVKAIKSLTGVNGDNTIEVINSVCEKLNKKPAELSWLEILIFLSPLINSTAFKALCSIGFFSTYNTKISRNAALYEYTIFSSLTDSEVKWIQNNFQFRKWNNLIECLTDAAPVKKLGGATSKIDRSNIVMNEIRLLKNPPYSLDDVPSWVVAQEKKLIGCSLSMSAIEASDTSSANTSCKEIINGKTGKFLCVAGTILRMNTCKVKNGKSAGELMSFLSIEDETCVLDNVVIFPLVRKQYEYCLYEGNNLLFCGSVSKDKPGLVVEKIYEI